MPPSQNENEWAQASQEEYQCASPLRRPVFEPTHQKTPCRFLRPDHAHCTHNCRMPQPEHAKPAKSLPRLHMPPPHSSQKEPRPRRTLCRLSAQPIAPASPEVGALISIKVRKTCTRRPFAGYAISSLPVFFCQDVTAGGTRPGVCGMDGNPVPMRAANAF